MNDWVETLKQSKLYLIEVGDDFVISTSPYTDKARGGYEVLKLNKFHGGENIRQFNRELAGALVDRLNRGVVEK